MTAQLDATVNVIQATDIKGEYLAGGCHEWLQLSGHGAVVRLFASHADTAATLIRLAGEALDHLDDEGRAAVLAAVREAFGVGAAPVCDCGTREVRYQAGVMVPVHYGACPVIDATLAAADPMGSPAEVGRG